MSVFVETYKKEEGNGNPLQSSCLERTMDRGALQATVHGVAKSQTGLSDFTIKRKNTEMKDMTEDVNKWS